MMLSLIPSLFVHRRLLRRRFSSRPSRRFGELRSTISDFFSSSSSSPSFPPFIPRLTARSRHHSHSPSRLTSAQSFAQSSCLAQTLHRRRSKVRREDDIDYMYSVASLCDWWEMSLTERKPLGKYLLFLFSVLYRLPCLRSVGYIVTRQRYSAPLSCITSRVGFLQNTLCRSFFQDIQGCI